MNESNNDSPLFENAIDSLKLGMRFFVDEEMSTSKKHAILAVFHAIELFLKEALYRVHPILIYSKIDSKIGDDSHTVGLDQILVRFANLGIAFDDDHRKAIKDLRARRNRIEHHRYDHNADDQQTLGKALKFATWFVAGHLKVDLEQHLDKSTLDRVWMLVLDYNERQAFANHRLEEWIKDNYSEPGDDPEAFEAFERFPGTVTCPICREDLLVMESEFPTHCFYCAKEIDAGQCDRCGETFLRTQSDQTWCGRCQYDDTSDDEAISCLMDKMERAVRNGK